MHGGEDPGLESADVLDRLTANCPTIVSVEEANPQDDPDLRAAFRRGCKASINGEPRPMDLIIRASDLGQAWLDGYSAHGIKSWN